VLRKKMNADKTYMKSHIKFLPSAAPRRAAPRD
jgi:hypothetical protein